MKPGVSWFGERACKEIGKYKEAGAMMWCGDVDTPPRYSLALRGHIGGSGGKAPGGVERHNVNIVIVEFGGAAYQLPPRPHTTHKRRTKTYLRFLSRYDLTNRILQTTNLFLQLWFATRKTASAPKARNTPTLPANAALEMTIPKSPMPALLSAPHVGISVTAIRSAALAANL